MAPGLVGLGGLPLLVLMVDSLVWGLGCIDVWGSGFEVWGLGVRVEGVEFGVEGLVFGVQG